MSEKLKPRPFCGEKVKVILTENIQVDGIFMLSQEEIQKRIIAIADYFLKVN